MQYSHHVKHIVELKGAFCFFCRPPRVGFMFLCLELNCKYLHSVLRGRSYLPHFLFVLHQTLQQLTVINWKEEEMNLSLNIAGFVIFVIFASKRANVMVHLDLKCTALQS